MNIFKSLYKNVVYDSVIQTNQKLESTLLYLVWNKNVCIM